MQESSSSDKDPALCLDTNILKLAFCPPAEYYRLEPTDRLHAEPCNELFKKVIKFEFKCFIPSIVVAEYIAVAARLYTDKSIIKEKVRLMEDSLQVIWLTRELIDELEPIMEEIAFSGADTLIAACAKHTNSVLVTYDEPLRKHLTQPFPGSRLRETQCRNYYGNKSTEKNQCSKRPRYRRHRK